MLGPRRVAKGGVEAAAPQGRVCVIQWSQSWCLPGHKDFTHWYFTELNTKITEGKWTHWLLLFWATHQILATYYEHKTHPLQKNHSSEMSTRVFLLCEEKEMNWHFHRHYIQTIRYISSEYHDLPAAVVSEWFFSVALHVQQSCPVKCENIVIPCFISFADNYKDSTGLSKVTCSL